MKKKLSKTGLIIGEHTYSKSKLENPNETKDKPEGGLMFWGMLLPSGMLFVENDFKKSEFPGTSDIFIRIGENYSWTMIVVGNTTIVVFQLLCRQ